MNLGKQLKTRTPIIPFPNIPSVKESSFWQQQTGISPEPAAQKERPATEYETPAPLGEHNLGAPTAGFQESAAEEAAEEPETPETPEEDQVPPEEQSLKAADLRNAKETVKQAKSLAERAKEAKEKIAKAAEIAKQLRNVQNLQQFLLVLKTATGVTLIGLVVTYLVMAAQFVLGNIFQIDLVPKLGLFEGIIFAIITFLLILIITTFLVYITLPITSITSLFQ